MIQRDSIDVLGGRVLVTGNTVIDALYTGVRFLEESGCADQDLAYIRHWISGRQGRKVVLVTGHRRERFGPLFEEFCEALRDIAGAYPEVLIVYPVHLNPNVQGPVNKILGAVDNVKLISPKDYLCFVALMLEAEFIITDSGGIQEEAPALGKPVLVTRENTERPEALFAGGVKVIGVKREHIVREVSQLLDDSHAYLKMKTKISPYGDGLAAKRCLAALLGNPMEEFRVDQINEPDNLQLEKA